MSERVFSDFTTVMIGDRLYNDIYNVLAAMPSAWFSTLIGYFSSRCISDTVAHTLFDGRELERHKRATWFWREPMVDVPEPPKRMVKKQIIFWVRIEDLVVIDGTMYENRVKAWKEKGYHVEKATIEIEVEE